jgi:hypothetical protein
MAAQGYEPNIGSLRRHISVTALRSALANPSTNSSIRNDFLRAINENAPCGSIIDNCSLNLTGHDSFVINIYDNTSNEIAHVTFHMNLDPRTFEPDETMISNHIILQYRYSEPDSRWNSVARINFLKFNLKLFYAEEDVITIEHAPTVRTYAGAVYYHAEEAFQTGIINDMEYNLLDCIVLGLNGLLVPLITIHARSIPLVFNRDPAIRVQTQDRSRHRFLPYPIFRPRSEGPRSEGPRSEGPISGRPRRGGGVNYYEKYLKYKRKYMELKNKIN